MSYPARRKWVSDRHSVQPQNTNTHAAMSRREKLDSLPPWLCYLSDLTQQFNRPAYHVNVAQCPSLVELYECCGYLRLDGCCQYGCLRVAPNCYISKSWIPYMLSPLCEVFRFNVIWLTFQGVHWNNWPRCSPCRFPYNSALAPRSTCLRVLL